MSSVDIVERLGKMRYFGGVYTKDELPNIKQNYFYIVNLDSSTGEGTHWVLVYNGFPDEVFYFDPMGEKYAPVAVENKMKQTGKKIVRYDDQIQNITSDSCGEFCCIVVQLITSHRALQGNTTPLDFLHHFFHRSSEKGAFPLNEELLEQYWKLMTR